MIKTIFVIAAWLLTMYQFSLSSAFAQYSSRTVASAFHGFYIAARKQTKGAVCYASDWGSNVEINMDSPPQMRISSNEVLYYNGSVRCDILGIKKRKPSIFVAGAGANADLAIDVDLRCFDEGTIGTHTTTWRLMDIGQESILIEARTGWAPEAWVKCVGK